MRAGLSYLLYFIAIAIAGLIIAGKYFGYVVPGLSTIVLYDSTTALLFAFALALISRWV